MSTSVTWTCRLRLAKVPAENLRVSRAEFGAVWRWPSIWAVSEDPRDLRQFLVAARTLRSDLRTFATVLDTEWVAVPRDELGILVTSVGQTSPMRPFRSTPGRYGSTTNAPAGVALHAVHLLVWANQLSRVK